MFVCCLQNSVFDITKPLAESKFNSLNSQNTILIKMRRFQIRKAGKQEQSRLRIFFLPSLFNPSSACCRG